MAILLSVFFFYPLTDILVMAFQPENGDGFTLTNLSRFTDNYYLGVFLDTIVISAAATILSIILGFPLAWHLHHATSAHKRAFWALVTLTPLMLSLVVSSFAWILILGSNGLVVPVIRTLGIDVTSGLLNSKTAVVIVTISSFISYMILNIYSALQNIDPSIVRAARIHGASPTTAFFRIILPLSTPGIVSGSAIVFAMSMSAFVIPFLIGGGRVKVIGLFVYNFTVQLYDWSGGAALGLLLFLLTIAATWAIAVVGDRLTPWHRRGT